MLSNEIKEKIAFEVIKTLVTRFDSFPEGMGANRNAPFHEAFLNAFSAKLGKSINDIPFFISLSSWLHGLNTTLGQQFFENVAHHLSGGEKREYTSKKRGNLDISQQQAQEIHTIITDLSNSINTPNVDDENNKLVSHNASDLIKAQDFSADVFIEDGQRITCIEIKSVKPNSGEMRGEKQKILMGKAALTRKYPNKIILFFVGFPFDPTVNIGIGESKTSFNKDRFFSSVINLGKFFDKSETLLASEFWDFLSGTTETMESILEIINKIATPDFLTYFNQINSPDSRQEIRYKQLLKNWYLFSELTLIENEPNLRSHLERNERLRRIYNRSPFKPNGTYDMGRFLELNNRWQ